MKKRFITKATSLFLVSQFLLSTAPLTAIAEENFKSTTDTKTNSNADISLPELPTFPVSKVKDLKSNEDSSSTSDRIKDDSSDVKGEQEDVPSDSTDSEEIIEESAEEKKEAEIPEDSNEVEEVTEQPSSEKEDEEAKLRNARVAVVVRNDVELRAALTNATVTQIQLANDITMTVSTRWLGPTKIIEGNNHTLTFARNVNLKGVTANQGLNLANMRIVADVANAITQSSTASVSIENITYANSNITGRFILFSGVNSAVNVAGNNNFNGGAFVQGSSFAMTLHNYATLKVNNNGTARTIYSSNAGIINLDPGSTLDVTQNNPSNTVKAVLLETSNSMINVSADATLKITSAPDTNKKEEALGIRGSLNVANDGTVDILGRSVFSTLNIGQTSTFQEGSNIRIQNNHTNGSAIGSFPGLTQYNILSSRGIQTWARGSNLAGDPTFDYSNFTQGSFSLNGYIVSQVTSNIISNDFQFNATFNSSRTAKIATGNFVVASEIAQTTINELTTSSTTVTGTGEPNAGISILNSNTVLTTGRVGSDGMYSLTIPPQIEGTTITARVSANGLTSDSSTVVGQNQVDLEAPELRPMFVNDVFVSGTVQGTSEFVAVYVNGVRQRTAAVNVDRSFSIYTGDYNLLAGQTIQVAAVTRDGANGPVIDEGPKTDITILDRFVAPVINPVHNDDNTVTGTIGGTARFVAVYVNGTFLRTAAVNANRTYTIYVGDRILVAGQDIQVAGVTRYGDTGPVVATGPITTRTILSSPQIVVAPTINAFTEGEQFVTGAADRNGTHVGVYINGVIRRATAINPDGTFTIYVGDLNLVAGDRFEMASINRTATGLIIETGPKREATVLTKAITIDRYVLGQDFVTGSISSGINRRVALAINGVHARWGVVQANGDFTVYASDVITSTVQRVEIVVTDASQTEIGRFPLTVNPN